MWNDRPWSPQSGQSSQPSHGMYSSTTTLSSRRSPSTTGPSTVDADGCDMDNAWTPHCGTSVSSGFDSDAANDYDGQACEDMEDDTSNGDGDDVDDDNGDGGGVPETDKGGDSNARNGGRSGQKKGRNNRDGPPKNKKQNLAWMLEERIWLVKMMGEDDALMADANGQYQFIKRKEWYAWVANRMASDDYPQKTAKDCCKKWTSMMSKAKLILDKQKELHVSLAFEKPLWDVMQWKLKRPSMTCDQTFGSEDLPGAGKRAPPSRRTRSGKSRSEARGTDGSEGATKMRRTSSGKTRMDDEGTGKSTLARAMEDSTRSYCDGLDKVASTLAKATSDVETAKAAKIGDVAEAIRGGNTVLEMLVGFSPAAMWGLPLVTTTVVDDKLVVIQEARFERGTERHRRMEWGRSVVVDNTRVYYALVNGLIAMRAMMRLVVALGFDEKDDLSEVIVFVKKLSGLRSHSRRVALASHGCGW
ncbi:hypothetical protein CBR_g8791 [Chara braunii]|uniref:Myb-like domain-containing protein n=1 Tax=Chara braunii TaxID=69332 RepID=A0A388KMU1_CHABU|nr:hypothetical protein CBR_g8791 [Chara braunii]|eukprot:GBG71372.1 hypothetical protein CBR_g8791 [Chara braunii]